MKKTLLPAMIALALLSAACSSLRLTVRNDRKTPVKDIEVKAGTLNYKVAALEPGASDMHELKVEAPGPLAVNFKSDDGGLYYTAASTPVTKGDGRKLLLIIDEKGNLVTEVQK